MKFSSFIVGIVLTAILLLVLALTRYLRPVVTEPKAVLTEVETVDLTAPDEPPMPEADEPASAAEELPQPALPELELLPVEADSPVALQQAPPPFRPQLSVDMMTIARAPAVLPATAVAKRIPRKPTKSRVKTSPHKPRRPIKPRAKPAPAKKAYYRPSELDGRPRQLRVGRFTWPHGAKGHSGTVKLEIEIDTRGRVRVIRVISTTDPKLSVAAMKVARGSRFTAPKKHGVAVKLRYTKTYHLKKP